MGTTLLQTNNEIGGARSVFVKLRGVKDDLIFPTHGGVLKNPFKGAAKFYAGDLMEFRCDANGEKPSVYLLKTYKVKSQTDTKVVIYKDGYKHIPFVGDILMKAPSVIGGTGKAYAVNAVEAVGDTWELTFATAIDTVVDGDVLVEAVEAGATAKMLVKRINAVAPCDYDCGYAPATSDNDWDGARYILAPALRGTMIINKMSPVPACVLALNKANVPGWFHVDYLNKAEHNYAELDARVAALEEEESGSGAGA